MAPSTSKGTRHRGPRKGWSDGAVATIDEAIAHDPDERYYREQRRRFTGERPAEDRPSYGPWSRDTNADSVPYDSAPGLTT